MSHNPPRISKPEHEWSVTRGLHGARLKTDEERQAEREEFERSQSVFGTIEASQIGTVCLCGKCPTK